MARSAVNRKVDGSSPPVGKMCRPTRFAVNIRSVLTFWTGLIPQQVHFLDRQLFCVAFVKLVSSEMQPEGVVYYPTVIWQKRK